MDSDDNKRNLSKNHANDGGKSSSMHDESQSSSLPLVKEPTLEDMEDQSDTVSNAGILFYKYFTKQMEKEVNELEEAIENIKYTIKTVKQNIMEMETEKQKIIYDFQEKYRKLNQRADYQHKLEDEIDFVAQFLKNLFLLKNDISKMKSEESYVRNYVISNSKKKCEELKEVENDYEAEIQKLQDKMNYFEKMMNEWERLNKLDDEMSNSMRVIGEKINRLQWSIKNETMMCEQIKNENEMIQAQTKMEINEKRQMLINKILQTQQNFHHVQNQFSKLNEFKKKDVDLKKIMEKLQMELVEKNKMANEIENGITITSRIIEELQQKNEEDKISLRRVMDNVDYFNHENEVLNDLLQNFQVQINSEQLKQDNISKTKLSLEEEIRNVSGEIEKLKTEGNLFALHNDLCKNMKRNETLKKEIDNFKEKKTIAKNQIIDFQTTLERQRTEISEMKKQLLSNSSFKHDLDSNNFLDSYLKIETQQNVIHESVESTLNNLFDEICDLLPHAQHLEEILKQRTEKSVELDYTISTNEKILQKTMEDIRSCDSSINALKQNVYQGKYITKQDLNRKLNILVDGIKTEQVVVEKLKKEIEQETRQKRPLFSIENKRKLTIERTKLSKSKSNNSQEVEENNVSSPDSDIYTFK